MRILKNNDASGNGTIGINPTSCDLILIVEGIKGLYFRPYNTTIERNWDREARILVSGPT